MTLANRAIWMIAVMVAARSYCFKNWDLQNADIDFFKEWERQLFHDSKERKDKV